ncbi:MAG: hypothetical protein M3154_10290 [Candidatus Eremiobacteraeota bacterium]|nr:hypothetical protein [Candidatus Eremiobacteraeota bacterium]
MRDLADRYFTTLAHRPMWFTLLIAAVCVIDLASVIAGRQAASIRVFNGTLATLVLILVTITLIRRFRGPG